MAIATKVRSKHFSARKFKYDDKVLEPGELFDLRGRPNDAALVGVGYIKEIKAEFPANEIAEWSCSRCARVFIAEQYLRMHEAGCPQEVVEIITPPDSSWPGEKTQE